MQAVEQISVVLPSDMVARLRARVRAGDFRSESEAVEDALGTAEAVDAQIAAILPEPDEAEIEQWLRTEVVAICDEMDRDPSRGIPIEQVIANLKAARAARGE